jgi:hypothetical protein
MMVFLQMGQSGSVAIDRQVQLNGSHEPDCFLLCCKQRNYCGADDGEPDIALWRTTMPVCSWPMQETWHHVF